MEDPKLAAMRPLMDEAGGFPFAGSAGFCRFPVGRDPSGLEVAILGIPLDITVFYRPGARFGPRAIREMSNFVLTELANLRHFSERKLGDLGDVWFAPGDLDHALVQIEAEARRILDSGARLLSLGGEHSVTLPLLRAHAARHGPLALLQFDSHTDLYDVWPKLYHGSFVARALQEGLLLPERCLQVGIRSAPPANSPNVSLPFLDADWVLDHSNAELVSAIKDRVGDHPCYLSFDIDYLDPAYAPATGTPVIGGPTTGQASRLLRSLSSLHVVGADIVELCPAYDGPGQITALAAASMAFHILELLLR